mmetsp:Transcript_34298/g.68312  ORF Transcript_34298/g.68312 Transcript_34298/m.68312 type:complete len:213 (+) Transcript_34298:681-1319(+)
MKQTTTRDENSISIVGVLDPHCHVHLQLLRQPVANVTPSEELSTRLACKWRLVYPHRDGHGRLLHFNRLEWLGVIQIHQCIAYVEVGDAGEDYDVTGLCTVDRDATSGVEVEELGDLDLTNLGAWPLRDPDGRVLLEGSGENTSDAQPAEVRVRANVGDLELEGLVLIRLGLWHVKNLFEDRRHVGADSVRLMTSDTIDGRGVYNGKVGLLV